MTNNVPNKIKILKKLVKEFETKLLENKLPESLKEGYKQLKRELKCLL